VASVYTRRFIATGASSGTTRYEVPEGKRAIVTFCAVSKSVPEVVIASVTVHGIVVVFAQVQAQWATQTYSLRAVAYERETIEVYMGTAGAKCWVCGYEFDDSEGRPPNDPIFIPNVAGQLPSPDTPP
jgi:hypothetical protein